MKQETANIIQGFAPKFYQKKSFECGDGWALIFIELGIFIETHCEKNALPMPKILQIKEKFGSLTCYLSGADETINKKLNELSARSERTCEICGRPGKIHHDGWIRAFCAHCHKNK